jgi:predicted nucleotidyltransferase
MLKIDDFLSRITDAHPGIREVWLFGSRAKGQERPNSDWNLFVFADQDTLEQFRASRRFRRADVQLLVVRDGDDFREPWGRQTKARLAERLGMGENLRSRS